LLACIPLSPLPLHRPEAGAPVEARYLAPVTFMSQEMKSVIIYFF